ncbi:MAG: GNAT family N-acetyltransferase [Candidatus Thermoplasmatota archaeon]
MLVVEPIRNEDVDAVADLAARTMSEHYDPEWLAAHAAGRGPFWVARDVERNELVGFALAGRNGAEGHLLAIGVDAARRHRGIGSALVRTVRNDLARSGAFRLTLEVRAEDTAAQAFYSRHGFAPEGLEAAVYRDGGDAVKMARPL